MKIGDNLRGIRETQTKLRQEDVAKALGISTKAYGNIENNIADITLTRLHDLSEILGVTPEYVLSYQDKPTYTNTFNNYDGNQGVINMYQGCSADQIKNIEEQIKKSQQEANRLEKKSRNN